MSKELEGIAGERLLGVSPQEVTGCGKRAQSSMGRRPEGGFPALYSEPQEPAGLGLQGGLGQESRS